MAGGDAGGAPEGSHPAGNSARPRYRVKDVRIIGGQGTAELPGALFDAPVSVPLIHQVVVAQQAAARQGTHATKTRGQVAGGGAKPWRQKGTGRARQGSRRAPQWTGGGVVHGPQPRDYSQRTPKKMIAAALRGALSDRARDGRVHVVASIVTGETPSTKAALKALSEIGGSKLLVVLDRDEDVAWLSLRNVSTVHALAVDQLNAYDVLVSDDVVFTAAALATFVDSPTALAAEERASRDGEIESAKWPRRRRDPDPKPVQDPEPNPAPVRRPPIRVTPGDPKKGPELNGTPSP